MLYKHLLESFKQAVELLLGHKRIEAHSSKVIIGLLFEYFIVQKGIVTRLVVDWVTAQLFGVEY